MLSGFVSDALGRRKALIVVVGPAILAFIILGFANSFAVVCLGFLLLSFIFGLKGGFLQIFIHAKQFRVLLILIEKFYF